MRELEQSARNVQAWLEADWCRHYRRQRKARRWKAASLVRRLKRGGACESVFIAWRTLAALARQGILDAPAAALDSEVPLELGLSEGECHRLQQAMAEPDASLGLTPDQATAWSRALERGLDDWSLPDQQRLVEGLRRLADALPGAYGQTAFRASARHLLGSSKLLEALPRELVRAFGIEPSAFRRSTTWLLAAMPASPEGLLLIENPQSFAQARALGLHRRLALVCSFGYGLSLAEAMADPQRVHLVSEAGPCLPLSRLLALPSATYWGDLDPEGLRIYRRLKGQLPRLRLSALLAPMAEALADDGHPLHSLTGKAGQVPARDWSRGLDQEWLEDDRLQALAGKALEAGLEARWLAALDAG